MLAARACAIALAPADVAQWPKKAPPWALTWSLAAFFVSLGTFNLFPAAPDSPTSAMAKGGSLMALGTQPFVTASTFYEVAKLIVGARRLERGIVGPEPGSRRRLTTVAGLALSVTQAAVVGAERGWATAAALALVAAALCQAIEFTSRATGEELQSTILLMHLSERVTRGVFSSPLAAAYVAALSLAFYCAHTCSIRFTFARGRHAGVSHSVPMLVAGMSPLHVYSAMVEGSGAIARAGGGAAAAGLLSLPSARGGLEPFSALEMGRVALLLAGTCFIATQSESAPSGRRIVEAYEKQGMHLRGGWSSGRAARHVESYVGRLRVINLLTIWALWASRYAASSAALDPISVLLCLELAVARLPGFYKRLWSRRR